MKELILDSTYKFSLKEKVFVSIKTSCNLIGAFILDQFTENEVSQFVSLVEGRYSPKSTEIFLSAAGHSHHLRILEQLLGKRGLKLHAKKIRESDFKVLVDGPRKVVKISKQPQSFALSRGKTKVLIIDDSKTIRSILKRIIDQNSESEVMGCVDSAEAALDFLKFNVPDVITLDINLPGKNGVEFLKTEGIHKNIPTIVISALNLNDSNAVFECIEAGAVDYLQKPDLQTLDMQSAIILEKIKAAAGANMNVDAGRNSKSSDVKSLPTDIPIFIGASTGGTVALQRILEKLPSSIPPICVVQHIPPVFSRSLAERLNSIVAFDVLEASDGDVVLPNQVLIAPGGRHMKLRKSGDSHIVSLTDDEPVNRFRPSIDYFFDSVSKNYQGPKLACILTGMGKDGAAGLLKLKESGAFTIAQSEATSVVFGMPKVAIELGAVNHIVDLDEIPNQLSKLAREIKGHISGRKVAV